MASERLSAQSEYSEEERAFLQTRVALFWKSLFIIALIASGLGSIGTIVQPGLDSLLNFASAVQAGVFWWLCQRGVRSIRFLRAMEGGGLLLSSMISAPHGYYLCAAFIREHALVGSQAAMLAEAYLTLMQVAGMALILPIRAALIPSRPRHTVAMSVLYGVPPILLNSLFVPSADGALVARPLDSAALPWLPLNMLVMWGFGSLTGVVISWIIYGLRAEVREARRLGQYVLEQKLGEGGMGEVHRARHGMMRRPSAIKLLRNDRSGAVDLQRFEREVQLTARLTHPNTITIFDYGRTHDGIFYYAMELLDGATLQRIVAVDGAQPPGRVVRILEMACGALSEAHGIGLIHRDIKPANIMLCKQGGEYDVVKLLDFGLVKEFVTGGDVELTAASAILGSPQYMAPESIRTPAAADARTDIYGLGTVAYFLLAGENVFDGTTTVEVCAQHLHERPEPFATRGVVVPPDLEALVLACLSKEPERRPGSAAELRRRLEACDIEPWDGTRAQIWWAEHRAELEAQSSPTSALAKTIAVDGAARS